ncbi:hypothetical protein ABID82_004480 [Methylobacterium sp. PvP062]|jgi:hypothetical protein|uniref:Uncharacterized protein n=1 Tax=Methylobacterium radiotolerans TaxID=31998 RepID=A0ABV2NKY8_9HYPH|nr:MULTISPECIES: hypothetical protein [unclassified Methylobacterium]MBP2496129.1 hypothetical protein [Methylobacterium sp. PvP105]MBP2503999.1 hypothetical protein [Methylobacterium sp. PvP109]MCX7335532.1 hypothetical protein [Hyphomicrobiales bacterium]
MIVRNIVACVLLLGAGPVLADTLPLRHGAYVAMGTDCKDPPNVALRTYDDGGLGSSKANDCRSRVLSKKGNVFEIEQDCRQFGGPKVERATERSTIRVDGPDRYTDLTGGGNDGFRLCPGLKP